MKKILVAVAALVAGSTWAGVTVTSFTQNANSLKVTVNYTLDAPAIVTADFQKKVDGVFKSIGEERFTKLSGDVNRYIETTGAHTLYWMPDEGDVSGETITPDNFKVVLSAWAKDDPPDYCAVNLATSNSIFYYTSAKAVPGGVGDVAYKTEFLLMRRIPAKNVTWKMGSPATEALRSDNETQHEVTLDADYYIGVYEFTQAQRSHTNTGYGNSYTSFDESLLLPDAGCAYNTIRGDLGQANWPTKAHTVYAGSVMGKLCKRTGVEFDLPTEAQWEFACRAGVGSQWNNSELAAEDANTANNLLKNYAYMGYNNHPCDASTASCGPVGSFAPNAFGLYDMHGNVREWCNDYYVADLGSEAVSNPVGPNSGSTRVVRGGGYSSSASECRCAYRAGSSELAGANAYMGFRVMAPLSLKW